MFVCLWVLLRADDLCMAPSAFAIKAATGVAAFIAKAEGAMRIMCLVTTAVHACQQIRRCFKARGRTLSPM